MLNCEFCVATECLGRKQFQHPVRVVEDIRRYVERNRQTESNFYDLNPVSDIGYAKRLFTALIPLNIQWFGLSTVLIAQQPRTDDLDGPAAAAKGCCWGLETVSDGSLKVRRKKFNGSVDYKN